MTGSLPSSSIASSIRVQMVRGEDVAVDDGTLVVVSEADLILEGARVLERVLVDDDDLSEAAARVLLQLVENRLAEAAEPGQYDEILVRRGLESTE